MQPCCGQHDAVVVVRVKLAQAGIDIAAQGQNLRIGIESQYLGGAAQAACTHAQRVRGMARGRVPRYQGGSQRG